MVRDAMEKLGYKPNRVARRRRQKSGRRHLLGLVIRDIENPFFAEIARGVEGVAYANEFAVMPGNSDEDLRKEALYLDVMRSESVDGIVLPPINEQDPAIIRLVEAGVPVVSVDRSLARDESRPHRSRGTAGDGPVISAQHRDRVRSLLAEGEGPRRARGGRRPGGARAGCAERILCGGQRCRAFERFAG